MSIFTLLNHLLDFLISPFHTLEPVPQLVLLSLISTVILLFIFKRVSNQKAIKLHKNKIFGNFLEIAIYRDQFRRSVLCQVNVLKHNLLYLKAIGTPLLIMMAPMILVCLQLEYRLGYQTLKPGASFIIEAQVSQDASAKQPDILDNVVLNTSDTITLESPPCATQVAAKFSGRRESLLQAPQTLSPSACPATPRPSARIWRSAI